MKKIMGVYNAPQRHWVGDGFPVRSLISYDRHGKLLSPFLLLDYTGTADFSPANRPRGVGQHPHRGFETVTIVYKKEAQWALLDPKGSNFSIKADGAAVVLFLSGEPLDEPIVGHGPFAANSEEEIVQAITDFNSGRFGQIPR